MRNPLISESLHDAFVSTGAHKLYRIYMVTMTLLTLAWWPAEHIEYFLQFNTRPSTFLFAVYGVLFFSVYFAIKLSIASGTYSHDPESWFRHTRIRIVTFTSGKIIFALFHSLFLIAIALPILVASAGISGIGLRSMFLSIAVIVVFSFLTRMFGLTIATVAEHRVWPKILSVLLFFLFFLHFSIRLAPLLNPVLGIQSILGSGSITMTIGSRFGTDVFTQQVILRLGLLSIVFALMYIAVIIVKFKRQLHRRSIVGMRFHERT